MDNATKLLAEIQDACRHRRFDTAHDICNRAETEREIPRSKIYLFRSYIYKRQKNYSSEKEWIEKSLNLVPSDKSTIFAYCDLLIRLKLYDNALLNLDELQRLEQDSDNQPFTNMVALQKSYCYYRQGNLLSAREEFKGLAHVEPSTPVILSPFFTVSDLEKALGIRKLSKPS